MTTGSYGTYESPTDSSIKPNVGSIALIFEGGGTRNAYTSAVVTTMLQEGLNFPKAYGVSAGAALAAGYIARDARWTKAMFTDSSKLPESGGVKTFFEGHGFFNTKYVFGKLEEEAKGPSSIWYFDYPTFHSNPADVHIEAFDETTGATVGWNKDSMHDLEDVMVRVRASCSYPLFTPATIIDGDSYVDGGMGTSHGICLDAARRDGFERFFIVRTQPRPYRMPPLKPAKRIAYDIAYLGHRKVYEALVHRPAAYNQLLDELDQLAKTGQAYVFCPTTMPINYMTKDFEKLEDAYNLGMDQCRKELATWRSWIAGS